MLKIMIEIGRRLCPALLLLFLFITTTSGIANGSTYDYIVVGSGPGGGTVAANLAKAGESVLLLEAGDDQGTNPNEEIAGWFFFADGDPKMRWDFFVERSNNVTQNLLYKHYTYQTVDGRFYVGTEPPPGAKPLGVYYPRAGTLGGCSTHNALVSPLPSNSDWDYIAEITGDKSWTHQSMRKYFEALETDHIVPPGTPGHGFHGPLDMSSNAPDYLRNQSNAFKVLQATAAHFGQDASNLSNILTYSDLNNNDPNRDQQVGLFGMPAHRTPNGRRVSARSFVVDVWNATKSDGSKKYPKFTVGLNSFVTKVLFDTSGTIPRATGINYLLGQSIYTADPRHNSTSNPGLPMTVHARKEVIISGGTFNTPQLLLLSGIGPATDLHALSIPVIFNLPGVGQNLQDNTEMGISAIASQPFTSIGPQCTYGAPGDPCHALWEIGKGPYIQGPLGGIFYKSQSAALNERDFLAFPLAAGTFEGYWPAVTTNNVPGPPATNFDFSFVKIHTQSRGGSVKLRSKDPRDTPLINFRFFEGPGADADLEAWEAVITNTRQIFTSPSLASLGPWTESLPCNGSANARCDVKKYVKEQAWSHHATSTCAIGGDGDAMAVLDSKFRVRGVKGLRVVDASIWPRTPGAFPTLPTFMVGWKAAEVILEGRGRWGV